MKKILLTFIILSSFSIFGQNVIVNYNTYKNRIENIYYYDSNGVYKINNSGNIDYIIIGNYHEENIAIDAIDNIEKHGIRPNFDINGVYLYVTQLTDVNYPSQYYLEDREKEQPVSINNYTISYYNNYYDDDVIKGKIKQIGNDLISYYKDFYLPDNIQGDVKKIGELQIKYFNEYPYEELTGRFSKIGNIKIEYYTNTYKSYLKNKIKRIGNYTIEYFESYGSSANNGKFKRIVNTDNQIYFTLITDY